LARPAAAQVFNAYPGFNNRDPNIASKEIPLALQKAGETTHFIVQYDDTLGPSAVATAAPMPREPPVMSAIFPSNFFDIVHLLELDICPSGMS